MNYVLDYSQIVSHVIPTTPLFEIVKTVLLFLLFSSEYRGLSLSHSSEVTQLEKSTGSFQTQSIAILSHAVSPHHTAFPRCSFEDPCNLIKKINCIVFIIKVKLVIYFTGLTFTCGVKYSSKYPVTEGL